MGTAIRESSCKIRLGKSSKLGMFVRQPRKRTILVCVCGREKMAGKKQNINPTWKILMKDVDLGEPTSFLDHVYLGCTQRECQISKDIVDNYRNMFESRISAGVKETYQFPRNRMRIFTHGPMKWKVMQRNAWKDIADWQSKQLNCYTKSQHHALMTINSKKKKWDLFENCLKFAHKLF